jgi:hypothetical protein
MEIIDFGSSRTDTLPVYEESPASGPDSWIPTGNEELSNFHSSVTDDFSFPWTLPALLDDEPPAFDLLPAQAF